MTLEDSRALWNRSRLDLSSDEVLAQLLDRGTVDDWSELYARCAQEPALRARVHQVVLSVPLPLPHFWLALLRSIGEPVDFDARLPRYDAAAL